MKVELSEDEQVARLVLLSFGDGDPHAMHLIMSPSNPERAVFIKNLALFGRRPDIAPRLPSPEVLEFFQEPEGHDEMQVERWRRILETIRRSAEADDERQQ